MPLSACGDDGAASAPSDCTEVVDAKVTLVAKNIQWDDDCFVVEAGTTVSFTVDLQDTDVKHDLQVSGQGNRKKTELETGPKLQYLDFEFPIPGYYQFVCTLHANMEGDIFAE